VRSPSQAFYPLGESRGAANCPLYPHGEVSAPCSGSMLPTFFVLARRQKVEPSRCVKSVLQPGFQFPSCRVWRRRAQAPPRTRVSSRRSAAIFAANRPIFSSLSPRWKRRQGAILTTSTQPEALTEPENSRPEYVSQATADLRPSVFLVFGSRCRLAMEGFARNDLQLDQHGRSCDGFRCDNSASYASQARPRQPDLAMTAFGSCLFGRLIDPIGTSRLAFRCRGMRVRGIRFGRTVEKTGCRWQNHPTRQRSKQKLPIQPIMWRHFVMIAQGVRLRCKRSDVGFSHA
jgi:hypothetical protein